MSIRVLKRLKSGIDAKRFTLTDAARVSGIPIMTLSDMLEDGWGRRVTTTIERLEKLDEAIDRLEGAA